MEYFNYTGTEYMVAVKSATLYPVVKVELLDEHENAYAEISEQISDSNGTIQENLQQGIRKTVSLEIFDPLGKFMPNANNELLWVRRNFMLAQQQSKKQSKLMGRPMVQKETFFGFQKVSIL